jgi:hypothetical protein
MLCYSPRKDDSPDKILLHAILGYGVQKIRRDMQYGSHQKRLTIFGHVCYLFLHTLTSTYRIMIDVVRGVTMHNLIGFYRNQAADI